MHNKQRQNLIVLPNAIFSGISDILNNIVVA